VFLFLQSGIYLNPSSFHRYLSHLDAAKKSLACLGRFVFIPDHYIWFFIPAQHATMIGSNQNHEQASELL